MRKILITTLILTSSFFMVGCSSPNNEIDTDSISKIESEYTEDNTDTEENLYRKFEELFPKVEKVLQNNGIKYEIIERKLINNKYSEYQSINVSKASKPGVFSDIGFGLGTDMDGNISDIRIVMFLGVDNEEIKVNGFKIEETMLNDIAKILIKEGIDYSETNDKINALYNNDKEDVIVNTYDNIEEQLSIAGDYIGYFITINP